LALLWFLSITICLPTVWPYQAQRDAERQSGFFGFFAAFYRAYKANDWKLMKSLAAPKGTDEYFDSLLALAEKSSQVNARGIQPPWNPRSNMSAEDLVTLALAMIAARQGATEPKAAKLTENQQREVKVVWTAIYQSCLTLIGAEDDPPPVEQDEIRDKCGAAVTVGSLSSNPGEMYFSVLAGAWLAERIGDIARSWSLRRDVEGHITGMVWPPVFKRAGHYTFALPGPNVQKR
jgi:hypothetical protein